MSEFNIHAAQAQRSGHSTSATLERVKQALSRSTCYHAATRSSMPVRADCRCQVHVLHACVYTWPILRAPYQDRAGFSAYSLISALLIVYCAGHGCRRSGMIELRSMAA